MKKKYIQIDGIPSIVWGNPSDNLYIYIHGRCGYKEEAEAFADIAGRYGWQVLSIDLPEHGERKDERGTFDPWHAVPELSAVMEYGKNHWSKISLCANSIGAWFSMLSYKGEKLENCLFLSPILDMYRLISNMMIWSEVSKEQLESRGTIPTASGQTLSWEYLLYAKNNPIIKWDVPTSILYGARDELTERSVVERFAEQFGCELTVMEDGEHWFHTKEQLEVWNKWVEHCLSAFH